MAKRMLVDATQPEETRVVVVSGNRLEELDFEIASRKQLKGNIYLAKVTRVEPSLQAAFVEYGGNRHGFLAFSEIHPDYYRIPIADREALLAEDRRYADLDDEDAEPALPQEPIFVQEITEVDAPGEQIFQDAAGEQIFQDDRPVLQELDASVPEEAEPHSVPLAAVGESLSEAMDPGHEEAGQPAEGAFSGDVTNGAPGGDGVEPVRLDVIGGDEAEEIVRRRPRPLRSYKIQEVIKRRQTLLVQVTKEERGTKGAALTTYLSLPGRYCVLMPNTGRGGGVSRKITNPQDRKRLKEMLSDLDVPQGMAVILRTAGLERSKAEIKRDLEYLLRLWDSIREQTLQSTAPELIYEEANLIKRSIRDLYANDIDEVLVEGEQGYRVAKDFMRMLVPSHAKRIQAYRDEPIPLFFRYQVESQIDAIHSPVVQLKSGGYIVINPTEALVAIDVNSGRSTRERNIEETAFKTNLEASDEIARQLRLRDLAGLIVIDFIDMEDNRNNLAVERRLKEMMKTDRARIQLGRISPFGLLELSRQRLRPSLLETNFEKCPHCTGAGVIRSIESAALHTLRTIEEEGIRRRSCEITVAVAGRVALYILNYKRLELARIEQRYALRVALLADDTLIVPDLRIERVKSRVPGDESSAAVTTERAFVEGERQAEPVLEDEEDGEDEPEEASEAPEASSSRAVVPASGVGDESRNARRSRRSRRGRRRPGVGERPADPALAGVPVAASSDLESLDGDADGDGEDDDGEGEGSEVEAEAGVAATAETGADGQARKRRRGKRGGRRRGRGREGVTGEVAIAADSGLDGFSAGATATDADSQVEGAAEVGREVEDFDWFLEGERPIAGPVSPEPAPMPPQDVAQGLDDSPDIIVASTEGDSSVAEAVQSGHVSVFESLPATATEPEAAEGEADGAAETVSVSAETGAAEVAVPRRRRRRAAGENDGEAEAAAAVVRRTRRRVKMATDGEIPQVEVAVEIAPEAAAEIMPVVPTEIAPPEGPVESAPDTLVVAPTEWSDEPPPPPVVIISDAPPPREAEDNGITEPASPPRRGWWSR